MRVKRIKLRPGDVLVVEYEHTDKRLGPAVYSELKVYEQGGVFHRSEDGKTYVAG